MTWMIDGGPEGYSEGKNLEHEGSAFKQKKPEPILGSIGPTGMSGNFGTSSALNSVERLLKITDKPEDYIKEANKVRNSRYYQEVTFESLHKDFEAIARGGSSKYVSNKAFGEGMIRFLKDKGFHVMQHGSWVTVTW